MAKIAARPTVQKAFQVCNITDRSIFATFKKPEGFDELNLFDMASHIKILKKYS
jgi:hypothetical protein